MNEYLEKATKAFVSLWKIVFLWMFHDSKVKRQKQEKAFYFSFIIKYYASKVIQCNYIKRENNEELTISSSINNEDTSGCIVKAIISIFSHCGLI